VERHRQRSRDARSLVFRLSLSITVLCFANFVNAPTPEFVEYWTEELDRLGDKIFSEFQNKLHCFAINDPFRCSTT